jgi:cobalamin biosynthesis protein CobD/CbiB
MIRPIIALTVFINVYSIYSFRNYKSSEEKGAFFSGVIGLVLLPLVALGVLLGATNIQGIHGDLGWVGIVILVWFFATCKSGYSLAKLIFKTKFKKTDQE